MCLTLYFNYLADLGHYTLFSRGILHRDVSVGNILRYSQAVQRPALEM